MKWFAFLLVSALPAIAQEGLNISVPADSEQPPGLVSAELLPGWVTPEGRRMTAFALRLEPGWKTYWRSPGDAGVPPHFDWQGSQNIGAVKLLWPRPEAIESGGERTLGYHDTLILPIEIAPRTADAPTDLKAVVDFGLCDDICVPVQVSLTAPPPQDLPDPRIEAALAQLPDLSADKPDCRVEEIKDGMRVTAEFDNRDAPEVAMELDDDQVWVSQPELAHHGETLRATAEFIDETGKPFALDAARVRLTLIGPDKAIEFEGCNPVLD
ncbi:protein-disulfide reductase DsbD domain-containing protein [Paracoccus aestuariivivens]|uniref:Thiol:disulfide interchange protein DsbD N-terminal domain-containing protein n=1 Tax=Paracoccus aestuariivivens TaxID=1820333 RepID=A0A6L6J365_9RHOB|nr:protein-disulfide reductase DsbD domain-containing protein [Paracoccus aestuariivivens]MTH76573.1 hypothetical protein [Paracoccus aestuariivivens]